MGLPVPGLPVCVRQSVRQSFFVIFSFLLLFSSSFANEEEQLRQALEESLEQPEFDEEKFRNEQGKLIDYHDFYRDHSHDETHREVGEDTEQLGTEQIHWELK